MSGRPATSGARDPPGDRFPLVLVAILLESAAGVAPVAQIETALKVDHKRPVSNVARTISSAFGTTISAITAALPRARIELSKV